MSAEAGDAIFSVAWRVLRAFFERRVRVELFRARWSRQASSALDAVPEPTSPISASREKISQVALTSDVGKIYQHAIPCIVADEILEQHTPALLADSQQCHAG